jgi:hypothetical protein
MRILESLLGWPARLPVYVGAAEAVLVGMATAPGDGPDPTFTCLHPASGHYQCEKNHCAAEPLLHPVWVGREKTQLMVRLTVNEITGLQGRLQSARGGCHLDREETFRTWAAAVRRGC